MNRARFVVAASIVGASVVGPAAQAQQTPAQPAPPMTSVLAGKKFTPPIKGLAEVQYVKSYGPKVEKGMVITEYKVKNVSNAPIPRLTIAETWYDGKGGIVTGGKGFINGLLQPNEVGTIRIETPYNTAAKQNMLNFSHANGDVKPKLVKSLDDPNAKQPAAKTASKK
jgi:hypothetical protein